ncbi:MAG TPA: tetratricopeptide repeat protein [Terriglobales bacterium]|nr:tetratricopeptide repeat protein [Terriglobales bacterium]
MKRRTAILGLAVVALLVAVGCTRDPKKLSERYVASGDRYAAKNDFVSASIQYRNAVQAYPQSSEAHYKLGGAYLRLQNWPQAYRELSQAVRIDAKNTAATQQLASLELAANRADDASALLESAIRNEPGNADLHMLMGEVHVQRGNFESALQEVLKAEQLSPNKAAILSRHGDLTLLLRRFPEAESLYRRAIDSDPSYLPPYFNLSQLARVQGDSAGELAALDLAVKNNPKAIQAYVMEARSYLRQSKADLVPELLSRMQSATGNSDEALLATGEFYLEMGKFPEAKAVLQRALEHDSKNVTVRKRLIEAHMQLHELAEAERLNRELKQNQPGDAEGTLFNARLLLMQGRRAEAVTTLQKLVHDAPDLAAAHFTLGLAYAEQGDTARAVSSLKESLSRNPNLLFAYMVIGNLYLSQGDGKLALENADQALKRNGRFIPAAMLRVNANMLMGKYDIAVADLRLLAQAMPNDASVQERLGYAMFRQGKPAEAEKIIERALEMQPGMVAAMQDLVALYAGQHRESEIVPRLRQQIARSPQTSEFYELMGNAFVNAGDLASAEQAYNDALRRNPDALYASLQLAGLYSQRGRQEEALAGLKKLLERHPDTLAAYALLGNIYEKLGNTAQAEKAYQDALQRDPDFAPALNNLAWLYAEKGGNIDMALGLAQRAKSRVPDNPSITDTLAWIEYRKGLYDSATRSFESLVRSNPKVAVYRYHLGMALIKSGRVAEGRASLRQALDMQLASPNAEEARKALSGGAS